VWETEWKTALAQKRELVLCVLTPLALALLIGSGAVPVDVAPASYAALFAGCALLRVALRTLRDGERGLVLRVIRGGVSPAAYVTQRAAAGAAISLAQLVPALLLAVLLARASTAHAAMALGAVAATVWTASLLGVVVAAWSRSRVEAVAFCAVGILLLLHMSGAFITPEPGGFGASLEQGSPFRALHESFTAMVSGGEARGVISAISWAVTLPVALAAWAPRLTDSLGA
jgi:hypothetical protein